jgi:DNA-binding NarL/FixJ family response regulator
MAVPLKTRVLLADDHPIVLRGLRLVLNQQPDFEVVAEASDGAEAVDRTLADEVDLAILDVSMPRQTGLQAARAITRRRPETRVLMLSMHENEAYLFEALAARPATCSRRRSTATSWTRAGLRCAASPSSTRVPSAP